MSNSWFMILGPTGWAGTQINTGNKKIDGKYYNILSNKNVQLSSSDYMFLTAGSGIRMITPGYVDASGIRTNNLHYRSLNKIDNSGNIISAYTSNSGGFAYKFDNNTLQTTNLLVFHTGLNAITMPSQAYGPLYIGSGNDEFPGAKDIKTYPEIQLEPAQTIVSDDGTAEQTAPPTVTINALTKITQDIQIFPDLDGYKDSILTHMGSGEPAQWRPAPYLKADGVLWHRYPKRPVHIQNGKISFYTSPPDWAQDWVDLGVDPTGTLYQEYGIGYDTIELFRIDTREVTHVKFASDSRFILDQINTTESTTDDVVLNPPAFKQEQIDDPEGGEDKITVYSIKICKQNPWENAADYTGGGYAYSITKGGYLDMQLGRDAKDYFSCTNDMVDPPEDYTPNTFKFKPSTINTISIRPNIHTAFNCLGENIDFAIYGKNATQYNNYENIFDPNPEDGNLPSGLIPAFRIDSYIPDSVSGNPSSGVLFTKYIDRNNTIPSGFNFDTKPKIIINGHNPYIISSLASGTGLFNGVTTTGFLNYYADLTVRSSLFSENIIAQDIYLTPQPQLDNQGKYIANALLTLDAKGKIISRIPRSAAVPPGAPSGLQLQETATANNDTRNIPGIGNGQVSLEWQAPDNDGNAKIIKYNIQYSVGNNIWVTPEGVDRPKDNSTYATIRGLSSVISYDFRVAAQNIANTGAFSVVLSGITPNGSVPEAPYNLRGYRTFDGSNVSEISLEWDMDSGGALDVLGYLVEESSDGGNIWYFHNALNELIPPDQTYVTINGTDPSQHYYYRISSWNTDGQSPFAYIYMSGTKPLPEEDIDLIEKTEEEEKLTNWDFGVIQFTGVCSL